MAMIRNLTCACCGGCTTGRQFHNQDKGFGLCPSCADWIEAKEGTEYLERTYGKREVHHSLKRSA